jgi:hypothetical protein
MKLRTRWWPAIAASSGLVLGTAGCGSSPSSEERAACTTFNRLEASSKGAEIQALREQLSQEAEDSGNSVLERAAKAFEQELAKGDIGAAGDAVGSIREECERLGIRPEK